MGMNNPHLIKSFVAGGTISPFRAVKFGADENTVVQAAAVADFSIGVSAGGFTNTSVTGDRVDVVLAGVAEIEAGAAVTVGALLTVDASGRGVTAAPAAGTNNRILGVAMNTATAAGDIISVMLNQGSVQG